MLGSILVGLIAGWLAGELARGDGYGVVPDIVLGLVGGLVGGRLFGVHPHHLLGSLMISTVGATALVVSARILTGDLWHDSRARMRYQSGSF